MDKPKPVTEEEVDKFIRFLKKMDPGMADPPRVVVRIKLERDREEEWERAQARG